jgi:hypothetical protein
MSPKVRALLDKGALVLSRLLVMLRALGMLRYVLALAIIAAFAGVAGLITFFNVRPIDVYRPLLVEKIRNSTKAEAVQIGQLNWTFHPLRAAMGIRAAAVEFRGVANVASAKFDSLEFRFQPLHFLVGRLPFVFRGEKAKVIMRASPVDGTDAPVSPDGEAPVKVPAPFNALLKRVLFDLRVSETSITVPPELLGFKPSQSSLSLSGADLHFSLKGLPGSFLLEASALLDADLDNGRFVGQGPFSIHAHGAIEGNDRPLVRAEAFEVDLSQLNLAALGIIEKTSQTRLRAQLPFQVDFHSPSLAFKSAELLESSLTYDEIKMDLGAFYNKASTAGVKWNLPRTEVKAMKLPIKLVREHPLAGIIESSGSFQFPRLGKFGGQWRFMLNNFRANPATLVGLVEKTSKGTVTMSFVSEGSAQAGVYSSPRTEFQLNASEAELDFPGGRFRKPFGDRFEILVKAQIREDKLDLNRFKVDFHTFSMEGTASLEGFSAIREKPGVLHAQFHSNRVDLAQWPSYFPDFSKGPLKGFAQILAAVDGPLDLSSDKPFDALSWRVDSLSFNNLRGVFDSNAAKQLGMDRAYKLDGPFMADFLFSGRGLGPRVDTAKLVASVDLSKLAFAAGDSFKKDAGIPFTVNLAAQQTRTEFSVQRGSFHFHTLDLGFAGNVLQGSRRSHIQVTMAQPVELGDWKQFFMMAPQMPLQGKIKWNGKLSYTGAAELGSPFDLRKLALDGTVDLSDMSGKFPGFKHPVRNGRGQIALGADGITIPDLALSLGGAELNLSGRAARRASKKSGGADLALLKNPKDLDISAQLTMSRYDPEDFAPAPVKDKRPLNVTEEAGPPVEERVRALLGNKLLRENKFKLGLVVKEGTFADIKFAQLNARTSWDSGKFRMEPLSVKVLGGKVQGAAHVDANPFYQSGSEPLVSASVDAEGLDINALAAALKPDLAKLVGGNLFGKLIITSGGFNPEGWIKESRGRLTGQIRQGRFDTLLALKGPIDKLSTSSAARDYLTRQAGTESCLQKNFEAQVDVQIEKGRVDVERGSAVFATGSSVEVKGNLDSELNVALAGDFIAGERCVGGDVRACLAGSDGKARLPFKITGSAKDPSVGMDYQEFGRKIASCAARQVARKAEDAVKKEFKKALDQPGSSDLGKSARDRLKKIFK